MKPPPHRDRPFPDRLGERMLRLRTRLVVGIDPVASRFPRSLRQRDVEEALVGFAEGVLDAVSSSVAAVKPQVAFFERHGWRGWRALQRVVEGAARRGVPVIADAKRGDIGSTARAYAEAFLGEDPETPGPYVDAVTVHPYLGHDSLEPFLERVRTGERGLFVLARTSNPGGAELQARRSEGEPVYLAVARAAARWGEAMTGKGGYHPVGLVAGATFPEELAEIRAAAPGSILLVPGLGAQGGSVEEIRPAFDEQGLGGLASASRSVIYAYEAPQAEPPPPGRRL
ncbi:MAG: orotidine-5'-phosphate decarboxylase [Planctomycetota bacterium]